MWPLVDMVSSNRRLSAKALVVIAGRLRGEKSVRGRPPQSSDQRLAKIKTHGAAKEFRAIMVILKRAYPRERGKWAKAIDIAANRAEIKSKTLSYYLKKSHRPL
jgi:hypothetical protein